MYNTSNRKLMKHEEMSNTNLVRYACRNMLQHVPIIIAIVICYINNPADSSIQDFHRAVTPLVLSFFNQQWGNNRSGSRSHIFEKLLNVEKPPLPRNLTAPYVAALP